MVIIIKMLLNLVSGVLHVYQLHYAGHNYIYIYVCECVCVNVCVCVCV